RGARRPPLRRPRRSRHGRGLRAARRAPARARRRRAVSAGQRRAGDFCWLNVLVPRPAEALAFFEALLGWEVVAVDGGAPHPSLRASGRAFGALFEHATPVMGVMVRVDSADAAYARVRALGGEARAPMEIFDAGRMVHCVDPGGAQFDAWEPKRHLGTDVDGDLRGAPGWFAATTTDVDRSARFYAELFGWSAEAVPPDMVFRHAGAPIASLAPGPAPAWTPCFTVPDVDAAARAAVGLGARVLAPARQVGGAGRLCALASPQGLAFGLISPRW